MPVQPPDSPSTDPASAPARWLEEHGDALFAYALRQVRGADAAEDLVQETLLAAIDGHQGFDGRSSERTWLFGILKHKIIDHFRRQSRSAPDNAPERLSSEIALQKWADAQFTAMGKWKHGSVKWSLDPSEQAQIDDLRRVLIDCLATLPDRAAEVFLHVECRESSTQNACKYFQMTPTNLGVILHRARLALRHCLQTHWFGLKPRDK